MRASREKKGCHSAFTDTMHGLPDRTGDLLLPFWSRLARPVDPELEKVTEIAAKRRGDGTMLDVLGDLTI